MSVHGQSFPVYRCAAGLLALAACVVGRSPPILGADNPSDNAVRKAQFDAEAAHNRALEARHNVQLEAARLHRTRADAAAQERAEEEKRAQWLRTTLASKEWAVARLDSPGKQFLSSGEGVTERMAGWKRARQVAEAQFVNHPDRSRGQVLSGRALNYFVEQCGPAALEHQLFREKLLAEREAVSVRLRTLAGPERQAEGVDLLDSRLALIDDVSGTKLFTRAELGEVVVQVGLAGTPLRMKLDQDPLPIALPSVITQNRRYAEALAALRESRQLAIDALQRLNGQDGGLSLDLQLRMMADVDRLCDLVEGDLASLAGSGSPGSMTVAERRLQLVQARRLLLDLRAGVARFVTARGYQDVVPAVLTAEQLSAADLIAHLYRHGLRFGPVEPNNIRMELLYDRIYRELVRYYVDLVSLQLAVESDRRRLAISEDRIVDLLHIELESFEDPTAPSAFELVVRALEAEAKKHGK